MNGDSDSTGTTPHRSIGDGPTAGAAAETNALLRELIEVQIASFKAVTELLMALKEEVALLPQRSAR